MAMMPGSGRLERSQTRVQDVLPCCKLPCRRERGTSSSMMAGLQPFNLDLPSIENEDAETWLVCATSYVHPGSDKEQIVPQVPCWASAAAKDEEASGGGDPPLAIQSLPPEPQFSKTRRPHDTSCLRTSMSRIPRSPGVQGTPPAAHSLRTSMPALSPRNLNSPLEDISSSTSKVSNSGKAHAGSISRTSSVRASTGTGLPSPVTPQLRKSASGAQYAQMMPYKATSVGMGKASPPVAVSHAATPEPQGARSTSSTTTRSRSATHHSYSRYSLRRQTSGTPTSAAAPAKGGTPVSSTMKGAAVSLAADAAGTHPSGKGPGDARSMVQQGYGYTPASAKARKAGSTGYANVQSRTVALPASQEGCMGQGLQYAAKSSNMHSDADVDQHPDKSVSVAADPQAVTVEVYASGIEKALDVAPSPRASLELPSSQLHADQHTGRGSHGSSLSSLPDASRLVALKPETTTSAPQSAAGSTAGQASRDVSWRSLTGGSGDAEILEAAREEEHRDEKDQGKSPDTYKQRQAKNKAEVQNSRHDAKLAYQINAVVASHAALMQIISTSVEVAEAKRTAAAATHAAAPAGSAPGKARHGGTGAGKQEQVPGCRCTIM